MMNIYDCFQYFDEDLLLDIRLNILDQYVKKFVITEATYTHNGSKKKLNFDINNFKKFKEKIEYIIVDDPPTKLLEPKDSEPEHKRGEKLILNGMARDYFQRENLLKGLKNCEENDIVLISDLDEIPNLLKINFSSIKNKIIIFEQKMFYYKLNLLYKNYKWYGTKACRKKHLISPQWLRNIKPNIYSKWRIDLLFSKKKYSDIYFVKDGGWHFTYLKSPEKLEEKLLNFAHHYEFEQSGLNLSDIKKFMSERRVVYDHNVDQKTFKWSGKSKLTKEKNSSLPEYIHKNLSEFKNWLD